MNVVTRINITDPVTLKRVNAAQKLLDDKSATKTAERLINSKLDDLGIPLTGETKQEVTSSQGDVTAQ